MNCSRRVVLIGRTICFPMLIENLLVWNVRGLNSRARRNVVGELVRQEHASLISLQETKLDVCDDVLIREMLGPMFDFFYLPACHTCGGILLTWKRDTWTASSPNCRNFSLTAKVTHISSGEEWSITSVYGPQADQDKLVFWMSCAQLGRLFLRNGSYVATSI